MASVETHLKNCAELRGTAYLWHRSIHEWAWFVSHMIWDGEDHEKCMYPEACDSAAKAMSTMEFMNDDGEADLRRWAELFEVYCRRAYA